MALLAHLVARDCRRQHLSKGLVHEHGAVYQGAAGGGGGGGHELELKKNRAGGRV
jgi:hypothetical protein